MKYNRRESLLALGTAAGSLSAARTLAANTPTTPNSHPAEQKFRFCLNTSTIRGQKSGILREVELAAAAGYDGIEPWIPNLREFRDQGGSIPDLGKRIADAGLTVDSAIGFAQWIHPDQATRTQALEEARRDMDMLKQMGGTRIAAPPVGAHSGDAPRRGTGRSSRTLCCPAKNRNRRRNHPAARGLGILEKPLTNR